MRNTFALLDDVLIERMFQPAADFIALWSGLSRSAAACCCVDGASVAWIVSRAPRLADVVSAWDAGPAFLRLTLALLGLVALASLRVLFRRAGCRHANPLRPAMRPHRAVALLMLLSCLARLHAAGLEEAAETVMLMCSAAALYLGACAERPPLRRGGRFFVPAS
ncbi:MAG TPA: hypothetical protein VGM32_09600 [Rhodopila sp.]|jgi:hypothetical protein